MVENGVLVGQRRVLYSKVIYDKMSPSCDLFLLL